MSTLSTGVILRELNELNDPNRKLTEINVTLGNLVSEITEDYNTRITVEAEPGRGYLGTVDVTYKRIVLSEAAPDAHIRSTQPFTKESTLALLNSAFQLFLSVDDLEDFTPPTLALNETANLTLTAKPQSFGWMGDLEVEFMFGRSLLDSVIGIRGLPLLRHPIDETMRRQSFYMATWGRDFTCLRDAIKVKNGNRYTDFAALQLACTELGIVGWAEGYIADYATSAVADSNKAFDRVVVQAGVSSPSGFGAVYLHYNLLDGA